MKTQGAPKFKLHYAPEDEAFWKGYNHGLELAAKRIETVQGGTSLIDLVASIRHLKAGIDK